MILGNTLRSGAVRENPNLTMGSCSSSNKVKISDFKTDYPIDYEKAVDSFKSN